MVLLELEKMAPLEWRFFKISKPTKKSPDSVGDFFV